MVRSTISLFSCNKAVSLKEVAQVVMHKVTPVLVFRVHNVNSLKPEVDLRTPSETERKKIMENPKFSEHRLEVAVAQKLGPRAIVYDVH